MSDLDPTTLHHIRFYQTMVPNKQGKLKPGFQLVVPLGLTEFVERVKDLAGVTHVYSWATHTRYISIGNYENLPALKTRLEELRAEFEERFPDVTLSIMKVPESTTFTPELFGIKDQNFSGNIISDDGNFEFYFKDGRWAGYKKLTNEDVELPVHPSHMGFPGGLLLNYSSTGAYKKCPWQYFAKTVARIPVYPNLATHIGWSVHAAAEGLHRKLLGKAGANTMFSPPINLEEALRDYKSHFKQVSGEDMMPPVREEEMKVAEYQGENMVRNYFDFLLQDEREDLKQYILVEKRMKFPLERKFLGEVDNPNAPLEFQGVPIWLAGTADLVYEVEPPEGMTLPPDTLGLCLTDLKTSVRGLDRMAHVDLLQHLSQLSLYAMMLEKSFLNDFGKKAKVIFVEIRNVTAFDGVRSLRVGFWEHSAVGKSDTKQEALDLNRNIINSFLTGTFNRSPGYHCTDCDATVPCFLSSGLDLNYFSVKHTEPLNIREDKEIEKARKPRKKVPL